MSWIKVETITPDKIEIARIATALGMDRDAVFGKVFRVWAYWDQHSITARIPGIDAAFLDSLVGHPGFCAKLAAVGWMKIDKDGITLPRFDRHNGETAKKRALSAKRMGKHRGRQGSGERNKSCADGDAENVTPASPEKRREEEKREEEKREEENTPLPPDGGAGNRILPFLADPPAELTVEWLARKWVMRSPNKSRAQLEEASAYFVGMNKGSDEYAPIPLVEIDRELDRDGRRASEKLWEFERRLGERFRRSASNGNASGKLSSEQMSESVLAQLKSAGGAG